MGLTTSDHTNAIRRETGYNEGEAAFLYAAAVYSGAFLRRQFTASTGVTSGRAIDEFIRKGTAWKHFFSMATHNKTRVYQVCKPVYGILGEPDNRNRRPKQATIQRLRLMSLDYVLANPCKCFLACESDRLNYLCSLGATPSVCPSRTYSASSLNPSGGPVTRYFIEKFPIFKLDQGAGFVFICENSLQTFEGFLSRYLPLAVALPEAEIVYMTSNPLMVKRAHDVFDSKLANHVGGYPDWSTFDTEFQERQAIEKKGFGSASNAELKRLRTLNLKKHANLYPTWQAEGMRGIEKVLGIVPRRALVNVRFSSQVIPENYLFL